MTNWLFYKNSEEIDEEAALEMLVSTFPDLRGKWNIYIEENYKIEKEHRLYTIDFGEIAGYIVEKLKTGMTEKFDDFFARVEVIIDKGNDNTKDLTVVGLLEGIQNVLGEEYYFSFDKWLKPQTRIAWDDLINAWKNVERHREEQNDIQP